MREFQRCNACIFARGVRRGHSRYFFNKRTSEVRGGMMKLRNTRHSSKINVSVKLRDEIKTITLNPGRNSVPKTLDLINFVKR